MIALFVGLVAFTSTLSCGPKRVVVDGTEMAYDEGARRTLEEARKAARDGDPLRARERYEDLLDRFAAARESADGLAELAFLVHEDGGCAESRPFLERLAERHPLHAKAKDAKTLLETTCADRTAVRAAERARFDAEFDATSSDAERVKIAARAAAEAGDTGDFASAVRWMLRARALSMSDAARSALDARIAALIDERVAFVDVRALLESLSGNEFPRELLVYKLGRIQYHVGDEKNATETLREYLATWPSGRFAARARSILELIQRRATVEPRSVGVLLPLTGKHRAFGERALRAIRLALGVSSEEGSTSSIHLEVADTKSEREFVADAVRDLVLERGVIAIVGAIFTYEAEPAAIEAERFGVPFLTISTAEDITAVGPHVFRNGVTNMAQMKALVEHAMDVRGMRSFAILYPRHPYGEELMHLFWDEVDRRGGEVHGIESYGPRDTTFTWQAKRLVARDQPENRRDYRRALDECAKQPDTYRKARCEESARKNLPPITDFDGLFIPDYPKAVAMISAALAFEDIIVERDPARLRVIERTLGRKVQPVTLLGTSGWNSEKITETAGRNVENAVFVDAFFREADDEVSMQFALDYARAHGEAPETYPEALLYDSASILRAILDQERPTTREAMRAALGKMPPHKGATGSISFREGRDATRRLRVLTIEAGRIREVSPPAEMPKG